MVSKLFSKKYSIATTLWLLALLVASFLPTDKITDQEFFFFRNEDKLIHFIMYSGLTFLALMANNFEVRNKKAVISILIATLSIGLLTELIQSMLPTRSMSFFDIIANSLGVLGGYLFGLSAMTFQKK